MTTWRHGTTTGYLQHQQHGERPCDACYRAKQDYDVRYRAAPERARKNRLRAGAQWRALARLRRLYPDVYARFYTEELARVQDEVTQR